MFLRVILLWLKAVFLQGEFYIRRRLFKECGVGLCEELVFINVIHVLGLWIEIDSLKKKKSKPKPKKKREKESVGI